ncbi:MAG TPA: hypothetical protein VHS80_04240 [Chthoniobacterales bacterium]|nr:hypothetical protein [Chthoniobacterales bacterium]
MSDSQIATRRQLHWKARVKTPAYNRFQIKEHLCEGLTDQLPRQVLRTLARWVHGVIFGTTQGNATTGGTVYQIAP